MGHSFYNFRQKIVTGLGQVTELWHQEVPRISKRSIQPVGTQATRGEPPSAIFGPGARAVLHSSMVGVRPGHLAEWGSVEMHQCSLFEKRRIIIMREEGRSLAQIAI